MSQSKNVTLAPHLVYPVLKSAIEAYHDKSEFKEASQVILDLVKRLNELEEETALKVCILLKDFVKTDLFTELTYECKLRTLVYLNNDSSSSSKKEPLPSVEKSGSPPN